MAETNKEVKIVKADKKKDTSKDVNASKVQIKAVDLSVIAAQKKKTTKTAATKTTAVKPAAKKAAAEVTTTPIKPIGTPMKKSSNASAMKKVVPTGAVPMKKKDSVQKTEEVAEVVSSAVVETEVKVEEKAPKKKTEKAKVETEVEAKEAVKEVKEAKSEIKEVKAEEKKEEQAPKKAEPEKKAVDYTPGFGVKIIRRAADEPAPIPSKPAKSSKPSKDGKKSGDKKFGSKNNGNSEEKKPKEYTGRKPVKSDNRDKVNNFNNQSAGPDGRRQNKNKKDKRDYMDEIPSDLSRNIKKKHSKYKEKVDLEPTAEQELIIEAKETGSVLINVPITLGGFCEQIEKTTSEAIMALMKMGIMANINQNLDEETAVLLGMELGVSVMVNKNEAIEEEEGIDKSEDRASDLVARAPIVTVMGHVDHGKTSLLDAIRSTNVTAGEAGGITQAIGASEINYNGQHIVFLDTPGHEAFTAMRARGAHITDIAVLVVAADDSVMPQTIESISHAKSAGVPVIVAINKIDKPTANLEKVKTDLAANGLLVEDWGGDVIAVPVSAKTGEGISKLLEMILLQAEVLELKANPNRLASGNVIEAKLDKNRGPVASLLVMNGTLQAGAAIVAGTACGRVRVMTNPKGEPVKKAGPARAVEITGLTEVPEAGDEFYMVKDEKTAREIAEKRKEKLRNEVMAKSSAVSLEKLFSTLSEGEIKDLNIIIKADVQGSVGALEQSLEKLHNDNVRVKIIHSGVGAINESDVVLASTSGAVIIGFNVRPSSAVTALADQEGVEIRTYRIIYEIIDDIEAAMKGMLDPEFKEVILGKIEVRQTYKISNVGTIAGAYVIEGKVTRSAKVRIVRDGIVVHEGEIASLKRFKDDAKEVATGFECGIGIDKFNDIKEGDIIEAFEMQEVKKA